MNTKHSIHRAGLAVMRDDHLKAANDGDLTEPRGVQFPAQPVRMSKLDDRRTEDEVARIQRLEMSAYWGVLS